MKYTLSKTRVIHSDLDFFATESSINDITLQHYITGGLCEVDKGRLPVLIEGGVRFLRNRSEKVGSMIFETKAVITFDYNETPIMDLIEMFEFVSKREKFIWNRLAGEIQTLALDEEAGKEAMFSQSYRIIEFARNKQLLILPLE